MTSLIRDQLAPLVLKATDGHAGLLMQRGLQVWKTSEKKAKHNLISLISDIRPSELYLLAFNRWLGLTYSGEKSENPKPHYASLSAQIDGRLFTGLSIGGTLETGAITHHSYGMPMLAGSAVKGAVRAYAENLFSQKDESGQVVLKKDNKGVMRTVIDETMRPILEILFGTNEDANESNAGYLIWHDAWWIPAVTIEGQLARNEESKPFVAEVVTVHHQKYYSDTEGELEALDMESPIPNQQIAIQGGFYFVIEGEPQWVQFAKQLLENMLQQMGMGAKGTSGYGYFMKATAADAGSNDPLEHIRLKVKMLDEKDLIKSLSSGVNSFFSSLGLDKANDEHCRDVVKIIFEQHSDMVSSWAEIKGQKNLEKAWKFLVRFK